MHGTKTEEQESLIAMRTSLTRALLAASLLRRKHGDAPDDVRLCIHITEAIANTEREIVVLESSLRQREEREASRAAHERLRPTATANEHQKNAAP